MSVMHRTHSACAGGAASIRTVAPRGGLAAALAPRPSTRTRPQRSSSRAARLGPIWEQWQQAGCRLVEDGELLPTGERAFIDSGTYAPTFRVGTWTDESGATHVFLADGYAASAEAIQAATLAPSLGLDCSLAVLSGTFRMTPDLEHRAMALDPDAADFAARLAEIALENRLPVIHCIESAGADLPNQADIFVPGGQGFRDITRRSRERLPTVSLVFGSSTAGGAYIPGMSDYTVMVREQAYMYLAGPPLVKMATGEIADLGDPAIEHTHVDEDARRTGPVEDHSALQYEVEFRLTRGQIEGQESQHTDGHPSAHLRPDSRERHRHPGSRMKNPGGAKHCLISHNVPRDGVITP